MTRDMLLAYFESRLKAMRKKADAATIDERKIDEAFAYLADELKDAAKATIARAVAAETGTSSARAGASSLRSPRSREPALRPDQNGI